MRDSNGQGSLYFDDLFINGIPWYSVLFYILHGGLALMNLLAVPLIFYGSYINSGFHRNYRLVIINLYLAFFLSSCGNFVYSVLVLSRVSDQIHDTIYYVFRFGAAFGADLWRAAVLSAALERTAATLFYKSYEKAGPLWLAIALLLFAETLAITLALLFFVVKAQYFVVVGCIAFLNFSCVLSVLLLFWSNKMMRKLNMITKVVLTQRYQVGLINQSYLIEFLLITENLRILRVLIPLIIIGTVFDSIALISAAVQNLVDYTTVLYYPMYYMIGNLYVSIALVLILKNHSKARRRIVLLLFNRRHANVEPEIVDLRNVDGKQIVLIETPDIHFRSLLSFWQN